MSPRYLGSFAFHDAIDHVSAWDDRLVNNLENSFNSSVNGWLIQHPFVAGLVHHPLISLVIGLIGIILIVRLFATIYRVIAATIDRMWLWILQSPFLLLKFLFGWEVKPKNPAPGSNTLITNYEVTHNPEQLAEIITRLDTIQQQQQQILQDIAQLKRAAKVIEPKQIALSPTNKP